MLPPQLTWREGLCLLYFLDWPQQFVKVRGNGLPEWQEPDWGFSLLAILPVQGVEHVLR